MSNINLLPPQVKEDQLFARRNRGLLAFARLAVFAAVFSLGVLLIQQQLLSTQVNHINSQLGSVRAQNEALAPVQVKASADEKQLNEFQDLSHGKTDWGFVFRSLATIAPSGIYITAITTPNTTPVAAPTAGATPTPVSTAFKIDGSAKDRTSIASFIDSLGNSGLFSDVTLDSSAPDFDQVNFAKYTFEIDATPTAKVQQ
jgi:Tfp pilus assembly protein PilN